MLPDSDIPYGSSASSAATAPIQRPYSFNRREALRTKVFWMLTLAMVVGVFGFPGYQAHWIPYFREVGFDAKTEAFGVFFFGIFGVSARFI